MGAGAVARSAPDGYTILAYGALSPAHALFAKLPYDTLDDFIPVVPLGRQAPGGHDGTVQGIQDARRSHRRRQGEARRLELFVGRRRIGVALRGRAPDGGEPGSPPSISRSRARASRSAKSSPDRVDFSIQSFATTVPLIQSGTLLPLAVSAHKRLRPRAGCADDDRGGLARGVCLRVLHEASTSRRRRRASIVERLHSRDRQGVAIARGAGAIQEYEELSLYRSLDGVRKIHPGGSRIKTVTLARAAKIKQQ